MRARHLLADFVHSHKTPTLAIDTETLWSRIEAASPVSEPPPLADHDGWLAADGWDERASAQYDRRRTFIAFYAYAVPTREAVDAIARFVEGRRVLEVCAGAGLWAHLLVAAGVDALATDGVAPHGAPYVPIEVAEAEAAVRAHPERDGLLLCWPPHRQDAAYRALRAFAGDRLVYVGDPRFTADAAFHALLAADWTLREHVALPSWPGLEDGVGFYAKR